MIAGRRDYGCIMSSLRRTSNLFHTIDKDPAQPFAEKVHPKEKTSLMKAIYSLLFVSMLVLFVSCEKEPVHKETPKITLSKKSAEIIEADQAFGFELFREIFRNSEEENIMISPMSVSYALGMTYNGSAGTTLDAFNQVLHFGDLTKQEVNESYKDLMDQLLNLSEEVEFATDPGPT